MKNRLFTILLMITLLSPVCAESNDVELLGDLPELSPNYKPKSEVVVDNNIQVKDVVEPESIQFKQPIKKSKIAKKFLFAMLGVGISSVFLFFILSLYRKVRSGEYDDNVDDVEIEDDSLETPDNLTDAIRTFIEKTQWEN